jgi:hypothetical protein
MPHGRRINAASTRRNDVRMDVAMDASKQRRCINAAWTLHGCRMDAWMPYGRRMDAGTDAVINAAWMHGRAVRTLHGRQRRRMDAWTPYDAGRRNARRT